MDKVLDDFQSTKCGCLTSRRVGLPIKGIIQLLVRGLCGVSSSSLINDVKVVMKLTENDQDFKKLDVGQRISFIIIGLLGSLFIPFVVMMHTSPSEDTTIYPIGIRIVIIIGKEAITAIACLFPLLLIRGILNARWVETHLIRHAKKMILWLVIFGSVFPLIIYIRFLLS